MFAGCPAYQTLTYGLNDRYHSNFRKQCISSYPSWYVTFATEEDTR